MDDVYAVFLVAKGGGFEQWRDEYGPRVFTSQKEVEQRARAMSKKGRMAFAGKLWQVRPKLTVAK